MHIIHNYYTLEILLSCNLPFSIFPLNTAKKQFEIARKWQQIRVKRQRTVTKN